MRGLHVCSFSNGAFTVSSPSGKTGLTFEDSDVFGPSKFNARTGDLHEISERLRWFWDAYPQWRAAGRPTAGPTLSTPCGDILRANFGPFFTEENKHVVEL